MTEAPGNEELIRQLAEEYGTPLYIYDASNFERRFKALKDCLPERAELFYAVKANPLLGVLQVFRKLGSGAEVASEGELLLALRAGFDAGNIIYTCPGKTRSGIERALRSNIHAVVVESLDEARLLNNMAIIENKVLRTAVRINPTQVSSTTAVKMSGVSSQFGVDEENLDDFFAVFRQRFANLELTGVHVYTGTQVMQASEVLSDSARILDLALRCSQKYKFKLSFIDMGGGFGVRYQEEDAELDLLKLREGYNRLWDQYAARCEGIRIVFESGRFLTADGGVFITRVLATKQSRGTKYVICDGGYSHHPASSIISRYGRNRFPVEVLGSSGELERVTIAGPTGTPVDILAKDVCLKKVQPGDLLQVRKSGAYGYTNSCQLFFSGPLPAELMLYRGKCHVLRRPGEIQAMLENQRGLEPCD